jgi:hypothetical protein
MRVGVDEAGQDRDIAEIDRLDRRWPNDGGRSFRTGVRRPWRAEAGRTLAGEGGATHHATATGEHPSSAHRGRGNRENPGGTVEDQWPVSRAFFSAALRAAYRSISGGRDVSPSARATASSSIRGTSRSRKIGSPCSS